MKTKLLIILIIVFSTLPLMVLALLSNEAYSQTEEWVARYSRVGSGDAFGEAVAVDSDRNVYVTGRSGRYFNYRDYTTLKYDSLGNQLWVAYYDGPRSMYDQPTDLVIDVEGNVYITGFSDGGVDSFNYDFATVKYDPDGNQLWVARYDGPAGGEDEPWKLAVDADGNVYVTGYSYGVGSGNDCATIKYDSLGNQLWVARYNGPANLSDGAADLVLDAAGNVYVTGSTQTGEGDYDRDCVTLKYNSLGNELWVTSYDGPANGYDAARAIALGANGNVCVTGYGRGVGTLYDYTTIKYDSLGNELWVVRYDGPASAWDLASEVALDDNGNVYVTGMSDGVGTDEDFATIKYDSLGNELWVTRYDGGTELYPSLAADANGNVYVTGWSRPVDGAEDYATIKYDSLGNELWVARYDGPASGYDRARDLAVDVNGNVYVAGNSDGICTYEDCTTIKYDSSGNEVWVARFDRSYHTNDWSSALAMDQAGNVYVTGYSPGVGTCPDYVTLKYDPLGNQLWSAVYNSPMNRSDVASALALDVDGNVYITGDSYIGVRTYRDYATVKHDSLGNQLWEALYDGPAGETDDAQALVIDASGNAYVTGYSEGVGTGLDYATIKYDSLGNQLWVARYDGPASGNDWAYAIATDANGYIYVTGPSRGVDTDNDCATVKYDSLGNELWVARYNGPASGSDWVGAIAIDGRGDIYITGNSDGVGTDKDYITIKYDSLGNELWVARYDGPASGRDHARRLATDASGNVYITGYSEGVGTHEDYATIKYDSLGNELWVARYDGPTSGEDDAHALDVDADGSVYITGRSRGVGTYDDYATIKYDSSGNEVWVIRYDGLASGDDWAFDLAVDDCGNVYVTGRSNGGITGLDHVTIKYNQYNDPPDPFSLLSPWNKKFIPAVVHFDWEDATDPCPLDQVRYDLYVINVSVLPPDTTIDSNLVASEFEKVLDPGIYCWTVKAKDNRGAERWSNQTRHFIVTGLRRSRLGELNGDGYINGADVVFLINYLYKSGTAPDPLELADVNCDGVVNAGDVVFLINYLFKNGPPPSC